LNGTGNSAGGNATAGSSGTISQAAGTNLHVENTADFVTFNGNIVIANNGNSLGRLQFSTGGGTGLVGSSNVTYVEDATAKLGNVMTNGTASIMSRFGSIIDDVAASDVIATGGAFILNAPAGSININSSHTTGTTDGNITTAEYYGSRFGSIFSNNTITLGNSNANSVRGRIEQCHQPEWSVEHLRVGVVPGNRQHHVDEYREQLRAHRAECPLHSIRTLRSMRPAP